MSAPHPRPRSPLSAQTRWCAEGSRPPRAAPGLGCGTRAGPEPGDLGAWAREPEPGAAEPLSRRKHGRGEAAWPRARPDPLRTCPRPPPSPRRGTGRPALSRPDGAPCPQTPERRPRRGASHEDSYRGPSSRGRWGWRRFPWGCSRGWWPRGLSSARSWGSAPASTMTTLSVATERKRRRRWTTRIRAKPVSALSGRDSGGAAGAGRAPGLTCLFPTPSPPRGAAPPPLPQLCAGGTGCQALSPSLGTSWSSYTPPPTPAPARRDEPRTQQPGLWVQRPRPGASLAAPPCCRAPAIPRLGGWTSRRDTFAPSRPGSCVCPRRQGDGDVLQSSPAEWIQRICPFQETLKTLPSCRPIQTRFSPPHPVCTLRPAVAPRRPARPFSRSLRSESHALAPGPVPLRWGQGEPGSVDPPFTLRGKWSRGSWGRLGECL